jgi:two-component sensor histidine kinase
MQKDESRVSIEGPEVLLEPYSAQAIAMTLHKLATIAAKYGALSAPEGQIEVKWSHTADGRLILLWTETGGPLAKTPTRQGFGGKVTKSMIEQLKGQTRFEWRRKGLFAKSLFRPEIDPLVPRSLEQHIVAILHPDNPFSRRALYPG